MTVYIPIIGALAAATGTILQKIVLRKKKISVKLYQVLEFLAIIIVLLPLLYFFWKLDVQALQLKNILVFASVVLFSIVANLFMFYSIKGEKISNIEPAKILEPLFVILFAIIFSFFFKDLFERNFKVIIPAIIAGAALIFSHIKKHHLNFNKYFLAAIAGSFFFALELVITRLILDFYSPISFYFLRCSAIFLISLALFRPNFKQANNSVRLRIFIIGIVWVIFRVMVYYGYLNLGVMFTTLILMLAPIFIYAFAHIFLKEKVGWRNIIAAIIIVGCVLYATLA
jgi:drug/metabolite transporter (DMT)-like permease